MIIPKPRAGITIAHSKCISKEKLEASQEGSGANI